MSTTRADDNRLLSMLIERDELAARCASLQYLLDELTGGLPEDLLALGLTPGQRRILGALLARPGRVLTRGQLLAATMVDRPEADWPTLETVDTQICKMRQRLKGSGVEIRTHWGEGLSARRADG